ncbi:MAG: CPBP family intramembrane metalloprotease [Chloroflexi bacterium]|nr:CPBP family intramembrane metalloprotease [Chloroflexota bacterium]
MIDDVRALVALGLTLLLVMLRIEADRFGAAEYDEPVSGQIPSRLRRLAWYAIGLGGVLAILIVHPAPARDLYLSTGDNGVLLGFVLAVIGGGLAILMAWLRYRYLRLPDLSQYPGALVNEVVTAVLDEIVFRGAFLGFLIVGGVDPTLAVLAETATYSLATRLGAPGRNRSMFLLSLVIGLVGGWATLVTGGIAAAILGHGVTRVAIFLATGHAGQPAPAGTEIEEVERKRRAPEGWRVVAGRDPSRER